ncbi:MAG TPA: hypothetical protein VLJ76_03460 [Gaiellaceae bacterium]|nr:hypothetical protein [Gaiellaceae bacterium]
MIRRLILAAVVAAVAVGAVSVATATIPDAGGVIHGCYSILPSTGQLRVIDTSKVASCGRNEKPLDWNDQGRTGATGPIGPTGPSGTSRAWFKEASSLAYPNPFTLLSLSLPPGTYMVTLTGEAIDASADGQVRVQCFVPTPAMNASVFVTGQAGSFASSGVASLASPGSIDVKCDGDTPIGAPADAVDVGLTAIQVEQANVE